ncbi:hypothetical protein ABKV19_004009 [Rosa sericea]
MPRRGLRIFGLQVKYSALILMEVKFGAFDGLVASRLLDRNNLTSEIPSTLGLVQTLETVHLGWNSLSGPVSSDLNNLSNMVLV